MSVGQIARNAPCDRTTGTSAPVTFWAAMPSAFRPLESPPTSTIRAPVSEPPRIARQLRKNACPAQAEIRSHPPDQLHSRAHFRVGRRIATALRGSVARRWSVEIVTKISCYRDLPGHEIFQIANRYAQKTGDRIKLYLRCITHDAMPRSGFQWPPVPTCHACHAQAQGQ